MDRGSVAINELRADQPTSDRQPSQVRAASAIIRLWPRVVGQSHLAGTSQVVGNSMSVGISTFSIVAGLGSVSGLFRGFVQLQLEGRGLH